MADDLKPCPFCGGITETDFYQPYRSIGGNLGKACAIYCLGCSANMTICHEDHPGVDLEHLMSALVTEWNRRALPVADPLCTWPSCGHTAKGQCRTYTSGQLIAPNDASITATNMPAAEPEPVAVNVVMCAAERDAQSRVAVDLTLFRQAVRAEALREAAKLATSFLVGDPKNGVPLRNPLAHEIADAIRALMEKPE